jgi:hypothetical protein
VIARPAKAAPVPATRMRVKMSNASMFPCCISGRRAGVCIVDPDITRAGRKGALRARLSGDRHQPADIRLVITSHDKFLSCGHGVCSIALSLTARGGAHASTIISKPP